MITHDLKCDGCGKRANGDGYSHPTWISLIATPYSEQGLPLPLEPVGGRHACSIACFDRALAVVRESVAKALAVEAARIEEKRIAAAIAAPKRT